MLGSGGAQVPSTKDPILTSTTHPTAIRTEPDTTHISFVSLQNGQRSSLWLLLLLFISESCFTPSRVKDSNGGIASDSQKVLVPGEGKTVYLLLPEINNHSQPIPIRHAEGSQWWYHLGHPKIESYDHSLR